MTAPRSASLVPFKTRLHKFLASAGVDSRRKCETLMTEGRVTVDGEEIRDLAYMVEPGRQTVRVDGEIVREQPKHYFMINKPDGYVCTHFDPDGRPRAIDLVPIQGLALFTIGRLDEDSEGLLLVTNDGQLAEKLAHPRFKVERIYRVQVAGTPTPEIFDQLKQGMFFEEGKFRLNRVKAIRAQGRSTWLEVVLTEGKNREIRRLLARVGHKVLKLQRVAFGPIRIGSLPVGEYRVLTARELVTLKSFLAGRRRSSGARHPIVKKPEGAEAAAQSTTEPGTQPAPGRPAFRTGERRMGGPRPGFGGGGRGTGSGRGGGRSGDRTGGAGGERRMGGGQSRGTGGRTGGGGGGRSGGGSRGPGGAGGGRKPRGPRPQRG